MGDASSRQSYVITYDIRDPKRLRRVYETMRGYGDHLQLSVFRCDLTRRELVELRATLTEIIDHLKDQVLFVDLGPADGRADTAFSTLGVSYAPEERQAIVV